MTAAPPEAQHHGPSHSGSVVLDVGEGIGALVLHTSPDLLGVEVDIVGLSAGTVSTHALVRPRLLPHATTHAAVYPGLPAGRYRVGGVAAHRHQDLEITGGQVTELDWTELVRTLSTINQVAEAGALS